MRSNFLCPTCASPDISVFFELKGVPINSTRLLSDRKAALEEPKGDMELAFCQSCGFIYNRAFDPDLMEYTIDNEGSQSASPLWKSLANDLIAEVVDRHGLRDKDILEIGCGQGEFLSLLCQHGGNRGLGIDPLAPSGQADQMACGQTRFIQDYYSELYSEHKADLILCRFTLEHIWNTGDFMTTVRRTLGDSWETIVCFEVPDVTPILRNAAFWDVYYEHCSYFSPSSLAQLFETKGFDVTNVQPTFEGQNVWLEALPSHGGPSSPNNDSLRGMARDVSSFSDTYAGKMLAWKQALEKASRQGRKCAVWGGGSKAVSFLNTLGVTDEVQYVVDINPRKQGMFVIGTGHEIVGPEFLRQHQPDLILVMNHRYCGEIEELVQSMGITAELMAI